jgi:MFS superfamily sulfate permease-like transporter
MLRFRTLGALLLVALFVLLPLYEFADIGEQWPHDGDVVLVLLFTLFLVALSIICRGVACACVALLKRVWRQYTPQRSVVCVRLSAIRCLDFPLFLIFCDLRV